MTQVYLERRIRRRRTAALPTEEEAGWEAILERSWRDQEEGRGCDTWACDDCCEVLAVVVLCVCCVCTERHECVVLSR